MRTLDQIKKGQIDEDTKLIGGGGVDLAYNLYKNAMKESKRSNTPTVAGGTANPMITHEKGVQGNQNLIRKPAETYADAVARNRARAAELSAGLNGAKATAQDVKDILFAGRNYGTANPTFSLGKEYDTMTPEEAGAFVSLTKQGKAQEAKEYLDSLQMELNRRNAEAAAQRARETAQRNAAAGVGLDVAGAMASGTGALYSLWQEARGKAIDPYHPAYGGVALREGAHEGLIGDSAGIEKFLKEAGLATAEWAGQALTMGGLAPFNMAAGAAGATSRDAVMRGGTTEEAAMLGVVGGAAEAVAEKIGFDRWLRFGDMAALRGNKGQLVAQILKDMGSEGLEEGATEIANILADTVIMGDKSQMAEIYGTAKARGMTESQAIAEALKTAAGQIGYSTGLGAVSGGMIGGGMAAMGRATGQNPIDRAREQYEAATRQPEVVDSKMETPTQERVGAHESVSQVQTVNPSTEMRTAQDGGNSAAEMAQEELEGFGERFYGEQGRQVYMDKARETGSFDHTSAFNTYYRAGVAGIREDEIKQTAYTAVADKGMLREAYMAGAVDSVTEIAEAIKGKNKLTGKRGLILGEDVKATDAQMALADFLGKTGGVQIRLVNKLEVTNDKGEVVGSANGKIQDGVITIALDADSFTGTAIHEMVHHIRKVNPAGYDAMRKLVFETANRIGVNMDKVMAEYESTYRAVYGDRTSMMDIMEEVTADGFQKILNDKNAYKEFVFELQKADKGLVAKIKEFLEKLMKTIESLLKDNRYTSFADALGEDLESVKQLRKMFAEVLAETGKMDAGSAEQTTDAKFSIRYTEDGRAVVMVDSDILSEMDLSKWDDDMKELAKKTAEKAMLKFKDGIVINRLKYYVNKISRNEYTRSNDAEKLHRENPGAYQDKMRAANHVDDIIVATTNWARDKKLRHKRKDKFKDFIHGDLLIQAGENQYSADTVVGITNANRYVFYDVEDITPAEFKLKEESASAAVNNTVSSAIPADSSGNSVAQKGNNGNRKFSLRDSENRSLSAGQREYFKDSKAVDENGRLLVMYHGTRKGEFEAFRDWTYLTANKEYAERYTDKDTGKTMYEVYANIQKPFDTRLPEVRAIFEDEFMGVYGGTPIQESGLPDWTDGYDLAEFIEENGYDFDAILLDEGADPDGKGGVIERGISYVIRSSEQAKDVKNLNPTSDKRLKFSMKEPVEETKNLIAVHNLYESNLKKVLDIGGFAMPSIAIIKDSMDHSKYGEISVVFGKETIDPRNKKNQVYGGDAWTPTIPGVNYEVNLKKSREFEREIWNLSSQILNGMFAQSSILSGLGIDEWTDNSQEQIAHRLADRDAVMAAYAAEHGIPVELEYKKKTGEPFHYDIIEHFNEQKLAAMVAKFELDGELEEADVSEIRGMYQKNELDRLTKRYGHSKTKEQIEKQSQTFANIKVTPYSAGKVVKEAWELYLDGGKPTDEIDRWGTQHNLNNAAKHDDVAAWVMPKLDGLLGDAGIYNGKDRYTPSGNRRSFKQLHHPYTLENLVKAMKANQKDRGEGLWGATASGLQSVTVPRYGSIAEIKADSGRLQMMGEVEYEGKLKEIDGKISEIIDEVMATNKAYSDNSFWEMDSIGEILIQAAQKGSANAVKTTFSREGYTITDKLAKEIYGMAREAASLPTGYFEAKPQRAVGFDEVRAVVVPDNIGKATRARLEGEGMNVIEYAAGDDQSRMEALNSVPDVKFSVRDQKYLAAVESGDMETAEQMVREAAAANGYNSPILYHGTPQFGFTEIDFRKSDDHTSFFMTDSVGTAQSYAGADNVRPVSGELSEEEKEDAIDDKYNEIFEESQIIYGCRGKYGEDIGYKCHELAEEVAAGGMTPAEAVDEFYEYCGEILEKIYYDQADWDADEAGYEAFVEDHEEFYDQAEVVADLMLDYAMLMRNFDVSYGIYKLVANLDNFLEIDAKGRNWNEIGWESGEGRYNRTRSIAEYANSKGYNGVIFRNIYDFGRYGGDGKPATVYIAFDGKLVKSADTVTYDANGDVIPLSERFDPERTDIRWSVKKDVRLNNTVIMNESTVDKLLRDYASPSSPKYAQAYIAYIHPDRFLDLTTSRVGRFRIENEGRDLDEENFKEVMLHQPIQLWIDHTTGQIEGHEGRHRCVGLSRAFVRRVPVLLFDSSNKYDKEHIAEMVLQGQDFGRERSFARVTIEDLIPFNYENREEIIQKFATQTEEQKLLEHFDMERTLRFSMKKESVEANIADSDHWKEAYESLLREFEITREPLKDRESGRKVVRGFLKEIKSGYSEEDFLNRFMDLCNYGADMQSDSDYKDLVAAMTMLTEDALKESADLDMKDYNEYADLRKELREYALYVSADTIRDLAAQDIKYTEYRRENFNRVKMSNRKGMGIDKKYEAWQAAYPEKFKLDPRTSQAALLRDIVAVRDSLDPVVKNPYFDQLEDYAESYAYELLGRMNEIALEKPTFADKHEAELRKLRAEHKEAMRKVKEQAKHEKELLRKRYADNAEARLEAAKQKYEKRLDRKEYWRLRKLAVKDAKALADWLKNPTDKNHVPKKFKEGVETILALIETDRPDLKIALQDFVAMKNGVMELYGDGQGMFLYRERDERVVDILDLFIQKYPNGANLDTMTGTDMKYFRELMASVKKACTDANKLHTSAREKSTVDLSEGFINESQKKKDARETGIIRRINDFLGLEMLDANSFFKRIGGDVYSELWKGLRRGMDKKVLRWKEAMDFINELVDPKTVRKWTEEPAKEFEIGGVKVYLSVPQIMSLSCLMRRDQARQHIIGAEIATETGIIQIRGGGFKAEVLENDKTAKKEKPKVVEPSEAEVKAIIGSLTEEQARVAYAIQKFMSENVAAWGNETTMLMFGYERFGTKNYFPIVSDKNFINQLVTKTEDIAPTLRSMGLTKNVNQYANNPVIIQDIFRVFANHVDQMSNYNAFVPSESDFNKFLNFKIKNREGRVFSVKDEMDRTMGKGGNRYIVNLMNRLVTANGLSDDSDFAKMLVRNMKVASVGANLRVILQQPTSYLRALNYISPKYLLNPAVFKKVDRNTIHENAPISLWKEWGNYEMDTGKSMYEQIIAPTKTAWTKDKLLAGAAMADRLTWSRLWNACLLEAKGKNPGISQKEAERIAGERFGEIVDESQVVDSILHRSQIMRKKGLYTQMTTSFMSEPMKTFNLASNALVELVRNNTAENRKKFARCYATLILSGVATACAAGLADAMRDDDEEEEFMKKWLKAVTGDYSKAEKPQDKLMAALSSNIGDNLNPMGMIPYLRDAWSLIQGYDIKRTDFDWLNDILKNMSRWEKFISGESEYTLSSMILNTAGAVSKMTGVPVASATRDLKALVNTVVYHVAGGDPAAYTEAEYSYQKMSKAIGAEKNMTYYTGRMLQAYLNGDKALANKIRNDMIRSGVSEEDLDGKLKSGYKAALREAYRAGDRTAMKEAEDLFRGAGADDNAIRDALRAEISAMFDEANEEGDKAEMERLIREYTKYNGREETLRKRMN